MEKSKAVAYTNGFKFVDNKEQAINYLKENNLSFGWFNGEFIHIDI